MNEFLQVGVITSTHGLKGEVKVFPTTDDVDQFKKLKNIFLDTKKEKIKLEIQGVKFFKQFVILKFKEFNSINEIEQYKKCELFITKEDAVPCEKDEYYIGELIGLKVVTDENQFLGELTDVLLTGANDVYVIQNEAKEEILIPAIKECIIEVNMEEKKMLVHLLDGLI